MRGIQSGVGREMQQFKGRRLLQVNGPLHIGKPGFLVQQQDALRGEHVVNALRLRPRMTQLGEAILLMMGDRTDKSFRGGQRGRIRRLVLL